MRCVWGNDCSVMELKYIGKFIGPDVTRSKAKVQEEKVKWDKQLQGTVKNFAQNKQRVTILTRILESFNHPQL